MNFLLFDSKRYIEKLEQRGIKTDEMDRKQIELGLLRYSPKYQEDLKKLRSDGRNIAIKKFISMRDNPEEYAKILREAERRKAHNIEVLRGYGLDI